MKLLFLTSLIGFIEVGAFDSWFKNSLAIRSGGFPIEIPIDFTGRWQNPNGNHPQPRTGSTSPPGRVADYSTCICRTGGRNQRCEGLACRWPCCECHDNKWLCCGEEICRVKGKKPFYEDCGCSAGGGGGGGGGGEGSGEGSGEGGGGGTPTPRPTDGPIFTPPPW